MLNFKYNFVWNLSLNVLETFYEVVGNRGNKLMVEVNKVSPVEFVQSIKYS